MEEKGAEMGIRMAGLKIDLTSDVLKGETSEVARPL